MTMSPPRPPSPPSGPPMGTNFSRRKEVMPEPPSPAFTRTTTRSMNISLFPFDARPQQADLARALSAEDVGQRVERLIDDRCVDTDVHRAVEMREQLAVLPARGTRGNDAELSTLQVEGRP